MSLWQKTQTLPTEYLNNLKMIYGSSFPIEVRHFLANWIEDQPWQQIEEDNPVHEEYAIKLLEDMVQLLQEKAEEVQNQFIVKMKLPDLATQMHNLYSNTPMNLVRIVKQCLTAEQGLHERQDSPPVNTVDTSASAGAEIQQAITQIQARTQEAEKDLKIHQQTQEANIITCQEKITIEQNLALAAQQTQQTAEIKAIVERLKKQKQDLEVNLLQAFTELGKQRLDLASKHNETFQMLDRLQKVVLDEELKNWRRQQQLAGNGAQFQPATLEKLQTWCEALAELTWQNRQQVKKVELLSHQLPIKFQEGQPDILPELNSTITQQLSTLVTSTFIVETQPPQVLKKDSRFTAIVRLLVGGKLNVHMNPPQVQASIISETQARGLLSNTVKGNIETGEILNNTGSMEYSQSTGQLSVTFRNMQLKRIKRADRKGQEAVTEEKFCILFQSDFSVGASKELVFRVWTLSLPVVVTVHGNQECNAMATILWDNAFAEPNRQAFAVPDTVPWVEIAEMLNYKFQSATGRGLTPNDLSYLATKIYGGKITDDFSQHQLKWSQFNKDSLASRNFTFWEWFYAVIKLTKEYLRQHWNDNRITGFISKMQAQEWLLTKPNGTFMLRFSDSGIGGITIAWVADDPNRNGERQVWNLAPFFAKDFAIRPLADRIKDLTNLVYLYPDIPKDQAFGSYYIRSQEEPVSPQDGYIKSHLINVIPSGPPPHAAVMNFENPQTPQISNPQSPEESIYERVPTKNEYSNNSMDAVLEDDLELEGNLQLLMDYTSSDISSMMQNTDFQSDLLQTT